jgi:hypothetical protein
MDTDELCSGDQMRGDYMSEEEEDDGRVLGVTLYWIKLWLVRGQFVQDLPSLPLNVQTLNLHATLNGSLQI